jgi:hypothetical protein
MSSATTAMALGARSLISSGASPRLRHFLITVLVVDDIGSLVVREQPSASAAVRQRLTTGTPTLFINDTRHERGCEPAALLVAARMVLQPEEERPQAKRPQAE